MPELPEVETIRRGLKKYIVGKTIADIEIRLLKIFQGNPKVIVGAKFVDVRRYGKGLVMDLDNGYSLTAHVKMTGQFVYQEVSGVSNIPGVSKGERQNFHPKLELPEILPNKHTHVIFSFRPKANDQRPVLYYNDIRQFGWLKVVQTKDVHDLPFFKGLGPEPPVVPQSGTMEGLTLDMFEILLSSSAMPIKSLLMDQKKISGVGNIYANDALYLAKIDPRRIGKSLTETEVHSLYRAVLEVLQKGIEYGGASETNYITVEGGKGSYQDHFLVYGKTGNICPRDGDIIKRIVQGGRSTFYCPACQR